MRAKYPPRQASCVMQAASLGTLGACAAAFARSLPSSSISFGMNAGIAGAPGAARLIITIRWPRKLDQDDASARVHENFATESP